jgi:hypothetical protein
MLRNRQEVANFNGQKMVSRTHVIDPMATYDTHPIGSSFRVGVCHLKQHDPLLVGFFGNADKFQMSSVSV